MAQKHKKDHTANRKPNRFSFFVVGYATTFALLAMFGGIEATRMQAQQEHIQKVAADKIASVTHNKALYALPQMDVTMASGSSAHRLQLGISLQMDKNNLDRFRDFQPKVSDRIVAFLDHQNMDDFIGERGMTALRNDILFEANVASGPVAISDIIFREFIVR
jgi:flagellar basal body-associated protein FliL